MEWRTLRRGTTWFPSSMASARTAFTASRVRRTCAENSGWIRSGARWRVTAGRGSRLRMATDSGGRSIIFWTLRRFRSTRCWIRLVLSRLMPELRCTTCACSAVGSLQVRALTSFFSKEESKKNLKIASFFYVPLH